MYQSSYMGEQSGISVPDGYGGTVLTKDEDVAEVISDRTEAPHQSERMGAGILGALFSGKPIGGIFTNGSFLRDMKLGTEEILILGAALFLLLSGSKDIECLIILLILLFVR